MFKIALSPLLASATDASVPTVVSVRVGDATAGPRVAGLALQFAARSSQLATCKVGGSERLGHPLWLPRSGATKSALVAQTHTQSGRWGTPSRHPSVRRGNWGHIGLIFSLRTIMSPSAQASDIKYLTQGSLFLLESHGGKGRFPSTRRKQVCGGCS